MEDEYILAAGGLVHWDFPDGRKIVIVHRKRHGDEWSLPKGKMDSIDKNIISTAKREVYQETGLAESSLTVEDFEGCIGYSDDGIRKWVLFWRMTVKDDASLTLAPVDKNEVTEARWVTLDEAANLLSHPEQRKLIRTPSPCLDNILPAGHFKWFWRSYHHETIKRLLSELGPFEIDLRNQMSTIADIDPMKIKKLNIIRQSLQLIECAKRELRQVRPQIAWNYYLSARVASSYLLENDPELRTHALRLWHECDEKLSSWRKKAVQELLTDSNRIKNNLKIEEYHSADKILHDDFCNNAIKREMSHFNLSILSIVCAFSIIAMVALLILIDPQTDLNDPFLIISVAVIGAMGGSVSGVISTGKNANGKIPERLLTAWITALRPIVGSASALAAAIFLLSGILNLGELTNYHILAISFISGFSERFIVGVIESKVPDGGGDGGSKKEK